MRTHEIWEPKDPQKTLVLFCDEINLPINDSYDTALIHEFLRVLITEKGFFNEKTEKYVKLSNILVVGACNPPTDKGRRELDLRLSTKFAILYVDYPEKNSLIEIYTQLLFPIFS